jgi:hypothetical protein
MRQLLAVLLAVFVIVQSGPSEADKPGSQGLQINNVKGTLPGGGTFVGNILIEKFLPEGGSKQRVRVVGTILQGTATTAAGEIQSIADEPFSAPATLVSAGSTSTLALTCPILFLDIGPIDLNVLGLVVDISEITINVTAIPGGGLLGNLLCSLANLLDNGSPLGKLLSQLNHLLDTILLILTL